MIQGALREVREEIPAFAGPALLAGLLTTLVLMAVMFVSPSAGVAGGLVVFSFFLLALASFPARAAWQVTGWRNGQPGGRQFAAQALNATIAVFFLVCAAAGTVWALGADLAAAAVTFAVCLVAITVVGHHFRDAGWLGEIRQAYGHVGWGPKLALAAVWLAVMAPEAIAAFDHEAIRAGRVWEPAVRTIVAILPLGWLLWESRLLRSVRPGPHPVQP